MLLQNFGVLLLVEIGSIIFIIFQNLFIEGKSILFIRIEIIEK